MTAGTANPELADLAFDQSPMGQALLDATGRIFRVNDAFTALMGRTREALLGLRFSDVTHPADMDDSVARVRGVLSGETTHFTLDKRYVRADGTASWCRTTVRPLRGADGALRAMLAQVVDISAARQAEEALRASEQQYRRMFHDAQVGMYRTRLDGSLVDVNQYIARMLGHTREHLLETGTPMHYAHADRRAQLMAAIRDRGEVADFEVDFLARDGTVRNTVLSARYDAGTQTFEGMLVDVTGLRTAERERAMHRATLQAVLDATTDAVMCLDREYRYTAFNQAHVAVMRRVYGTEVALGLTMRACIPDDRQWAFFRSLLDRALAGEAFNAPQQWQTVEGTRWVEVDFAPVKDAEGKVAGVAVFSHDVSARHHAEEEHRLIQAQLAQADRLASMGMLAAGVAHELNNPLMFVAAHVEALEQELGGASPREDGPTAVERVRETAEGLRRIQDITRSLHGFARTESGAAAPIQVTVPLDHAAAMAQNELRFRAQVRREYADTPPVLASEGKLVQVFVNLLVNAAHATPEGNPEAHAVTLRTHADAEHVYAEVADTGTGIAPALLERIFEPFVTTKEPGKGTGLGLTISRGIVRELGGDLQVRSTPGAGSTFVVRLPRAPDVAPSAVAPGAQAPAEPARRARILVVDDEPGIRRMLLRALSRRHDVTEAPSGQAAMELLRAGSYDLVISDVMMPNVSGMELHEWARGQGGDLADRFLFLTGGAFTPRAAAFLSSVPNARMEKPVSTAELMRGVDALLAARGGPGAQRR